MNARLAILAFGLAYVPCRALAQSTGGLPALKEEVAAESVARRIRDAELTDALNALQAQVTALQARVDACACSCSWEQIRHDTLAFMPADAIPSGGAFGGGPSAQSFQSIGGRTAWTTTSDWLAVWIPHGLTPADDRFAVQFDMYVSAESAPQGGDGGGGVGVAMFTDKLDTYFTSGYREHGVTADLRTPVGQPTQFSFGDLLPYQDPIVRIATPVAMPLHVWKTVRVEGVRSQCRFVGFVDGVKVLTWTATTCDLQGGTFEVSGATVGVAMTPFALSEIRVFKGVGQGCVAP